MEWQGWFTLIVLLCMIVALVREILGPDIIVFITLGVLICAGVVTPAEAVSGFSNKGMLTVAILFVVAAAIQNTGAFYGFFYTFMGKQKKPQKSFLRIVLPVSILSAFLNNTPIVVMFTPIIRQWAIDHKISPSKLMIPLSYAAILGGMCTLIGTSTTLIVNGLMIDREMPSMSMFEIAKVGLPCALIGLLYLKFVGRRLLPDRKDLIQNVGASGRQYLGEMRVLEDSPLAGKNIEEAGLRHLKGLFLVKIIRGSEAITAVAPKVRLQGGDKLIFTGMVSTILDLQNIEGLVPITGPDEEQDLQSTDKLAEAVVSPSSPLIGTSIRDSNFRTRYRASILAVHRNGERIASKIGDIIVRPGDTLLLLTSDAFDRSWTHSRDFYLVSNLPEITPFLSKHRPIALTIMMLMVAMATLGPYLPAIGGHRIDMFVCAFGAALLMLVTRCISPDEARESVEINVLLLIACAFGIGIALDKTGLAAFIADGIIAAFSGFGTLGILGGLYLLTIFFSCIITNNATAVLMFPIAYATALRIGADPRPFAILVAIAASASFATPIAYQTNMLVYGPGGYRFSDYLKVGLPLNFLLWITVVAIIPLFWSL
ncbi:SLC13 family permease [Thermodesulfobacteriota bacterium]